MSKFVTVLKVAGALAAIIGIGLLLGWFGSRGQGDKNPPQAPHPSVTEHSDNPVLPAPRHHTTTGPSETTTNENPTPAPATADNVVGDWEAKLEHILTSTSVAEPEKAKQMLEFFPRLPQEGQIEVARHIANLLPDSEYASLGKFLVDPKMPEPVLEVLLGDVLNRPHSVKMPLLLEIAKQSDHPKAGEAKELLQLFLEEDYGNDWNQWQTKLDQWLKDNPD